VTAVARRYTPVCVDCSCAPAVALAGPHSPCRDGSAGQVMAAARGCLCNVSLHWVDTLLAHPASTILTEMAEPCAQVQLRVRAGARPGLRGRARRAARRHAPRHPLPAGGVPRIRVRFEVFAFCSLKLRPCPARLADHHRECCAMPARVFNLLSRFSICQVHKPQPDHGGWRLCAGARRRASGIPAAATGPALAAHCHARRLRSCTGNSVLEGG
jgi:hypothetical protein